MSQALLKLSKGRVVRTGRDRRFILDIPQLTLSRGQCIALVAPSGRGKTTMLNLLALAIAPTDVQRFQLGSADVSKLWNQGRHDVLAQLRARAFGYVVQTGALLSALTAFENIRLSQQISGRKDDRIIADVAARLGIDTLLGDKPSALSVGERQRVAIARALVHRPAIVLADEPTAALDPANKVAVMELLLDLTTSLGTALVIATHDLESLQRFGIDQISPTIDVAGATTRSTIELPAM